MKKKSATQSAGWGTEPPPLARPRRALLLAFLFLPVLRAEAFQAGKLDFHLTGDLLFQHNQTTANGRPGQFYGMLSLFSSYGKWSAGITLRGNNFFKQTPNQTFPSAEFGLYRKFVQYDSRYLKIGAGDFYCLLGRGLVLSVLKNEDVLLERTITGGDVRYSRGILGWRALAGRVRDDSSRQEWSLAGGELSVAYLPHHAVGAHFSYVHDRESWQRLGKRLTYSVSVHGTKLLDSFSYYAEWARLDLLEHPLGRDDGHGFYSSLTYSKSRLLFSLEFKRYRNFANEMNNPPLADREDEISSVNDTSGVRLYAQMAFLEPDITVFLNYGRYREYEDEGDHLYAGVSMEDLLDRLDLSFSYGVRDVLYSIRRAEGHALFRFSDRLSAEATFKDRRYADPGFVFQETDHMIQVSYSPRVSVFAMHQFSHNKVLARNHFYSGGLRINWSPAVSVELSGGTMRGGQVCSGGQCYVAPPFKGLKCSVFFVVR